MAKIYGRKNFTQRAIPVLSFCFCLFLALLGFAAFPLFLAAWVCVLVVCWAWIPADSTGALPTDDQYLRAQRIKTFSHIRTRKYPTESYSSFQRAAPTGTLFAPFSPRNYRLAPSGDFTETSEKFVGLHQRAAIFAPLTFEAVTGLVIAFTVLSADRLLATLLALPQVADLEVYDWSLTRLTNDETFSKYGWADWAQRNWLASSLSGLFTFAMVKGVAAKQRASDEDGVAPTGIVAGYDSINGVLLLPERHSFEGRFKTLRWLLQSGGRKTLLLARLVGGTPKRAIAAFLIVALAAFAWLSLSNFFDSITSSLVAVSVTGVGFLTIARNPARELITLQRSRWVEVCAERRIWEHAWLDTPLANQPEGLPTFFDSYEIPTLQERNSRALQMEHRKRLARWHDHQDYVQEEIEKYGDEATVEELPQPERPTLDEVEVPPASLKIAHFRIAQGRDFASLTAYAPKLTTALGVERLIITSIFNQGGEKLASFFQVIYDMNDGSEWAFSPTAHMDENEHYNNNEMVFVVSYALLPVFAQLKLGVPHCHSVKRLTSRTSPSALFESVWELEPGITRDLIAAKTIKLQEKMRCEWLRVGTRKDGSSYVSILYGDNPRHAEFQHSQDELFVARTNWHWWMRAAKLVGADDATPNLESSGRVDRGEITKLVFSYPDGLEAADIEAATRELSIASTYPFVEFDKTDDTHTFGLLVGEKDPLNSVYLFNDYKDKVLIPPVLGETDRGWWLGINNKGEMVRYEWESELPHLLVGGSSGSGKSATLNSMLFQLLHNNTPDDVELWMLEPKNELQAFRHCEHVRYFLDGGETNMPSLEAGAIMLEAAVAEMERRNSVMSRHPRNPKKLNEAREFYAQAPDDPINADLAMPFLYIIIEECADYFAPPAVNAHKEFHQRMIAASDGLARKSRAMGMHLVFLTQYPTKQGMPTTTKQQCKRIGLLTDDKLASRVIIDRNGLEQITAPGRGLVSSEGEGYTGFRSFYIPRPDKKNPDIDDEFEIVRSRLPMDDRYPKLPPGVEPSEASLANAKAIREFYPRWLRWIQQERDAGRVPYPYGTKEATEKRTAERRFAFDTERAVYQDAQRQAAMNAANE